MRTHWLVEETKFQNDFNVAQRLSYLLQEKSHPVTTFPYIPFGGTDYNFIEESGGNLYGEAVMGVGNGAKRSDQNTHHPCDRGGSRHTSKKF